jgi:phosphohistidine phosphatase
VRLYLLRHAIAAERDPARWPDDRNRPLTREGAARMARAARGMRRLGLKFDLVLSSPLARTVETARIVSAGVRTRAETRLLKPLAPGGGSGGVLAALSGLPARSTVLLVGHEPDLSHLAAGLIMERRSEPPLEFKKGGLCRIDTEGSPAPGNGRLVFHLTPRVLRRLGNGRA